MITNFSAVLEEDRRWLEYFGKHQTTRDRLRSIEPVNSGDVFLLARAEHVPSKRTVLLTIARPGNHLAVEQLGVCRELYTHANDERIGTVVDAYWSRKDGWGCLATSWHDALVPLESALSKIDPSADAELVLGWLRSICRQLQKIHEAGYAHGDVSMTNIAVDSHRQVHLIDFEHAASILSADRSILGMTPGHAHPGKANPVRPITIQDHQVWDRYALGQVFLTVLAHATPKLVRGLTPRIQRGIRLIGCLLLDGWNRDGELALGLDRDFFVEEKFVDLDRAIWGIDQLTGRWPLINAVPELKPERGSVVEVGLTFPVAFTKRVEKVVSLPSVGALEHLNQLGLISFIWPNANHNRMVHSLGAFGLAARALESLNADPESPLFAILVTPQRAREVLLAALLHDVGHYPLAHDFEEAHPLLFDHEKRGVRMVQEGLLARTLSEPEAAGGWAVCAANVASIIAGEKQLSSRSLGKYTCAMLHTLISGPVDVDKLDYLVRDSRSLNVKAGEGLDVSRIIAGLTVVVVGPGPQGVKLAVRSKARRPAELVGRVRSHLFGVAYWHHTYRSVKALIRRIVWDAFSVECSLASGTASVKSVLRDCVDRFMIFIEDYNTWRFDVEHLSTPEPPLPVSGEMSQVVSGALPPGDAQALHWFAVHGSPKAKELFDLLVAREWFKAVVRVPFVLEGSSDLAGFGGASIDNEVALGLWKAFSVLRNLPPDDMWATELLIAEDFENRVSEWIKDKNEGQAGTIVVDFSKRKGGLREHLLRSVTFLIDGPDMNKAHQKELYWSIGDLKADVTVNVSEGIEWRRSLDEYFLQKSFVATNGSICVYCHPDHASFVQSAIPEATLAEMLLSVMEARLRGRQKLKN